jgi:MFS family permease
MNLLSLLSVIIPSLGGMYFGLVSGVIGGVTGMPSFLKYLDLYGNTDLTTNVTGNIVSVLQAGGCGGAITAYIAAGNTLKDITFIQRTKQSNSLLYIDRLGRKKALIINTIIYVIGSALQAGTQNVPMMLFGRFVGGCM